jgi:hypothetical protein
MQQYYIEIIKFMIQVKKEQLKLLESKIDNFADKYYNTVK